MSGHPDSQQRVHAPTRAAELDPRIDHQAWWDARMAAGATRSEVAQEWRQMNSSVTLSNGHVRRVDYVAGAVILLVRSVCEEMGVKFIVAAFDWPTKGAHVCIRTPAAGFSRVTSADGLSELRNAEYAALSALRAHRASLFGQRPMHRAFATP